MAQVSPETDAVFLHPDAVRPLLGRLIVPEHAQEAGDWFATLADTTRVRILQALSRSPEWCVGDLALALSLSMSALSHQLHYLRERSVVARRQAGREVFYRLADDHVRHVLLDGIAHVTESGRPADR